MRSVYCSIIIVLALASISLFVFLKMVPNGYIVFSMNPEVKFVMNRLDEVIDIVSLNEEGHILTADFFVDLEPLETKINKIVDDSIALNMLSDEISVSLIYDSHNKREKVKDKVIAQLKDSLILNNLEATILIDEKEEVLLLASEHQISYRHAYHIYFSDSLASSSYVNAERAYKRSVKEIKQLKEENKGSHYYLITKNSNIKRSNIRDEDVKNINIDVHEGLDNMDQMMRKILDDGIISSVRSLFTRWG